MLSVNKKGVDIIKAFEGIEDGDPTTVNLDPYLDPLNIWTIGWGHAIYHKGKLLRGAKNGPVARALYPGGITLEEAEKLIVDDSSIAAGAINKLVRVPLNENQFSALVSFVFNIGVSAFSGSTLLRLLNSDNYKGAAEQFLRWNKGTIDGVKIVVNGLTNRRHQERNLFLEVI